VKAAYAFDSSVIIEQARATIALANGVLESQVSLIAASGRRLDQSSAARTLRRSVTQEYEAVISTTNLAQATAVLASSADTDALAVALEEVAPGAPPPTVEAAPVAKVVVRTALISDSGIPVMPPMASSLNTELSNALGETVSVQVESVETSGCSGGACVTGAFHDGTASSAHQLAPLLFVSCAGLAAAFVPVL